MHRTLFAVALSVVIATPAFAQQPLKLSFHDGRVSVDATSVPVRTILDQWSKIGGTKVIGADRITGAPMTVKLVNVTEAQALETILKSVAGYMAAPRNASSTGPSMYDRILVMATTTASAPPAASAAVRQPTSPNAFTGTQRFVPPRQRPEDSGDQDEVEEPDENPPSPPVFTFPQPGQQPATFTNAPGVAQPGMNVPAPQTITVNPPATTAPGQPAMPVGVSRPGMMVPAPQPTTPPPPGMIRPPGQR